MKRITACFRSLQELVDFQMTTNKPKAQIDLAGCSLTGQFTEAELELAVNGYQARTFSCGQERGSRSGLNFSPRAINAIHD